MNPVCPASAVPTAIHHPRCSITHADQVELLTNNRRDKFLPAPRSQKLRHEILSLKTKE